MSFYGNIGDSSPGSATKKTSGATSAKGGKKSGLLQTVEDLARLRAASKAKKQEEKTKRKIGVDTITAAAPELIDAGQQLLIDQGILPTEDPAPQEEALPEEEEGFLGMPYSTWALIGVGVLAAGGVGYWAWKKSRRA